jgi:hypothetical protein
LRQRKDRELPHVLPQVNVVRFGRDYLYFFVLYGCRALVRQINKPVSGHDLKFKFLKATIANEYASRFELYPKVKLTTGFVHRGLNGDLFVEPGVETYFFRSSLERSLVSSFRQLRNIDP